MWVRWSYRSWDSMERFSSGTSNSFFKDNRTPRYISFLGVELLKTMQRSDLVLFIYKRFELRSWESLREKNRELVFFWRTGLEILVKN